MVRRCKACFEMCVRAPRVLAVAVQGCGVVWRPLVCPLRSIPKLKAAPTHRPRCVAQCSCRRQQPFWRCNTRWEHRVLSIPVIFRMTLTSTLGMKGGCRGDVHPCLHTKSISYESA